MKHIVFLTLTLTRGGAERVIVNLCNDFLCEKYKVSIITCMNKPVGYELRPEIEHICIEKTSDVHYRNLFDRFMKRRKLLKSVLKECKPDVLLCFLPEPNFLALSLKHRFSFPMIISVRNDPKREYKNPVYYAIMRCLYPKSDGYVFQTRQAMEYFKFSKHITKSAEIIPNPLGRSFVNAERIIEDNRKKTIVNVGKLSEQKNQKLLIEAFSKISKHFPNYILEIYGEGNLRKELELLIETQGLENRVFLMGNVADVSEKIKDVSLFVLSSDYEGMPNALMEAMALGVPCIATDCPCGGPQFLIRDKKNGRLVSVGDTEQLAAVMSDLLMNRDLADQYGLEAMKIVEALHPDIIHEQWEKYIKQYL